MLEHVATCLGLTVPKMLAKVKTNDLTDARMIAAHALRTHLRYSYPAIARQLQKRSHETVMNALRKYEQLSTSDKAFKEKIKKFNDYLILKGYQLN